MNYGTLQKNTAQKGSLLVSFSFFLALVSCIASGYLFFQWNQLSSEKKGFESVRIQLEDQIASLETDLQMALKEQQKLKLSVDTENTDKAKTLAELTEVKAASEKFQLDIKKLKNERDSLKKLAVQLKTQAAQTPVSAASDVIAEVPSGSSPAGHLKASSDQPSEPMKVKTINRTFNFVVFDLVPGVTLRAGDAAVVERDGQWISDLKIKQVYAQFVSAEIRKEDDNNLLQIGDSVKRV